MVFSILRRALNLCMSSVRACRFFFRLPPKQISLIVHLHPLQERAGSKFFGVTRLCHLDQKPNEVLVAVRPIESWVFDLHRCTKRCNFGCIFPHSGMLISNHVPFVVPGLSASSSSTTPSPTSPSSSSQDSVFDVNRYTENPVPERNGGMNEELRGDPLHDSTETTIKIGNRKRYKEIYRMICLINYRNSGRIWLMKVLQKASGRPGAGSADTSKSSHELPMEPRAYVEPGSGKHSVFTHFPKDPNCAICLMTKITRGLLQKTRQRSHAQSGKIGD